ncbi:unnamed protein product [Paramecium sonneborni]|uniref:Uncharacterized protein n=1 Tax=Paramecium sonneborni TaxID=65129 RepID=A0A8S1M423_9CILI|nr:unnamed protein product [Paramecium sonneborni]
MNKDTKKTQSYSSLYQTCQRCLLRLHTYLRFHIKYPFILNKQFLKHSMVNQIKFYHIKDPI